MAKKEKDIPMPMQLGSVKKQPVGVRVVCGILKYLFDCSYFNRTYYLGWFKFV